MERLVEVAAGSSDVAVGVSGFGSAGIAFPRKRWESLAGLSGATTYALLYDAQELPWTDIPYLPLLPISFYNTLESKWTRAKEASTEASEYLAEWVKRWTSSGRSVTLVGFSLGAHVVWQAAQRVASDKLTVVLLLGALPDRPECWEGSSRLNRLVNVYSTSDLTLQWLYPAGVAGRDTPAAGLGPLCVSSQGNVLNVDVTDLVGLDHLEGSRIVGRLVEIALCVDAASRSVSLPIGNEDWTDEARARLYRWASIDSELEMALGQAVQGDEAMRRSLAEVDVWSVRSRRLSALLDAGRTASALAHAPPEADHAAMRNRVVLSGLFRRWFSETT